MTRPRATLLASGVLLVVLVVVALFLPVPYVILLPGPVTDTTGAVPPDLLANGQKSGPVITISGAATQPSSGGHLYLTTVDLEPGSCTDHPDLVQAVKAWLSSSQTVEPQQVQCPPGQSAQQVRQQGEQEMTQSQSDATTAALFELGYKPGIVHITVGDVDPGSPAATALEAGDIIDSVDGTKVTGPTQLQQLIRSKPIGSAVTFMITRDGKTLTPTLHTVNNGAGTPIVGIDLDRSASFPGIQVKIGIDPAEVGGPSAGTALALGIVDKLTPGGLTGGRTIAGTGTVDGFGNVGPIGGIQQKIAAAVSAHATVFFAPASECQDAKAAAPKSLTLIKVTTLHSAVVALQDIKAGNSDFPHC